MNIYKINFNLIFTDDGEVLNYTDYRKAISAGAAKEITRDLYTDEVVKVEILEVELYK